MLIIGKKAPYFSCQALIDNSIRHVSLDDFKESYKIIFFYPLDFSFVCPTELHAFQDGYQEFKDRNATVLGISVDSIYSHQAWLAQPKTQGGIQGISYPLLSDITKSIARSYGVLNENEGVAYRGVFLLDQNNIVQALQVNNMNLGRNSKEILRLLDALIFTEKHGESCPANWSNDQEGIQATSQGVIDYFNKKK
jgi:peroxiredoxin 2/4